MIIEKDGKFYHDEHEVDIKITNDNTKSVRNATIHVRSDGDPQKALELAVQLYKDALTK